MSRFLIIFLTINSFYAIANESNKIFYPSDLYYLESKVNASNSSILTENELNKLCEAQESELSKDYIRYKNSGNYLSERVIKIINMPNYLLKEESNLLDKSQWKGSIFNLEKNNIRRN